MQNEESQGTASSLPRGPMLTPSSVMRSNQNAPFVTRESSHVTIHLGLLNQPGLLRQTLNLHQAHQEQTPRVATAR
jgi:hypothetical protein